MVNVVRKVQLSDLLERSVELTFFDESFQFINCETATAFAVSVLALCHSFLNDSCDFLCGLSQHLVHILCHRVTFAEVLGSTLSCLGIRVE